MTHDDTHGKAAASERALLGALILDGAHVHDVQDEEYQLRPEDFVHRAHRILFRALVSLSTHAASIDFHSVLEWLRADADALQLRSYDEWLAYVIELSEQVASSAHWCHHAKVVRDCSIKRATHRVLRDGCAEIDAAQPGIDDQVVSAIDKVGCDLYEVTASRSGFAAPRSTAEAIQEFEAAMLSPNRAMPTMIRCLDERIVGLRPQQLGIVGARPGCGKSALLLCMSLNLARSGKRVLFFSLEMSRAEIAARALANLAGVDLSWIIGGQCSGDTEKKLRDAKDCFSNLPLQISESPRSTVESIRRLARRMKLRSGLDVLVVDYLQRIHGDGKKPRWEEIAAISWALKSLALELDIAVIAACQLTRQAASERPQLHHLKESGAIEQDADWVLLLWEDLGDQNEDRLRGCLAKQRNGATGDLMLRFERPLMRVTGESNVEMVSFQ